jgi:hypothetical protein
MSAPQRDRFKVTSVLADDFRLADQLNSFMNDDWRVVTVIFQPEFKDADGNNQRAHYVTVWERKDA